MSNVADNDNFCGCTIRCIVIADLMKEIKTSIFEIGPICLQTEKNLLKYLFRL